MSTVVIRRPPRRPAPEIPIGELSVQAPPEIPAVTGARWHQMLMVLPLLGGTVAMAMMFGRGGGAYSYLVGGMFGLSSLAMLATSWGSASGTPKKSEMMAARREYLRHLKTLRRQVRQTAVRQRAGLCYRHPDPALLWSTVDSHRVWERRPTDPDFAVVRIAVGPQTLATPLVPPVTRPLEELEPMTAGALRRFLDAYSVVPDLPVALSLRSFARVFVRGTPAGTTGSPAAQALVRAMLTQLTVFHAPDELLVAVCAGPERRSLWEWVKWLPHAQHPTRSDALGPVRLVTSSAVELERLLDEVLSSRSRFSPAGPATDGPHLVVVLDGGDLTGATELAGDGGIDAVTLIDLDTPPPRLLDRFALRLELRDGRLHSFSADETVEVGTVDALTVTEAEAVARRLAPLRLAAARGTEASPGAEPGLPELLGIGDPEGFTAEQGWAPTSARERLRVPVGVGVDGGAVELDLKESAQDGMGPHGLLIGATGSGKSELLRTLVLGLAATHSSEQLNFVLVDFKGGATFASFDRLPHTAAVITNLADALPLVDRMVDAINGELVRRQELLRRAGNFASLRDYERARTAGSPLAPLPSLLLICDEFSELLSAKPDFIDLFVQIGRLGRSLGVHLLLASQRLEEGRLRGLDTHLSYRIGLRTFSALESRTVLGAPDAYELPRSPGHGYLRFGTEPLARFKAAYVSGPVHRRGAAAGAAGSGRPRPLAFSTHFTPEPQPPDPPAVVDEEDGRETLLDLLVARLAGQGPPAHQVWLPPLADAPVLDELVGPLTTHPARGLTFGSPELHGALQVPVAVVDRPYEQRRDLLWLALDGAAGHVALVGGTQSGKSTALRTLICALALTHTPAEAQVYCLDFGGGGLAALRDLPHVGGVTGRADPTGVRRTVGEISTLLADRERAFAELGVESMAAWRQRRDAQTGAGEADADRFGDVFLVVDGWVTLRGEYDDLEPLITDLATRGLSYGVHVVATAVRWLDFRPGIRDLFGSRLELRLGDPSDSLVARRAATHVPEQRPGRGITSESLHFLTALPQLAGTDTAGLVRQVRESWSGPAAPRVRLLPAVLPYADLDLEAATGLRIPVGIAEADLRPVVLDFATEPHFVVYGDAECGKSSFLRALATSIITRFTPEQARVILVDYRRSLLGAISTPHLIGYGTAAAHTAELVESAAGYLQARIPGPEVSPVQLRERSWWSGPELFVLVDDYDLVASGPANPLRALEEHLPHARDVGLHLVLVRRSGGAARAQYEPVVQRLRELSTSGLVMSGSPEEGALVGPVRPGPLPPGRGRLLTRREGVRLVQLAHLPPQ
ncbi:DNA segregation ATPase FtsK/SpoIIIE, S-DNA-T family [Micromonospora phaseoli]|uniref:DNA segregation ATPase FtsK/SpoIIIE, S-DNA-T family n=1 Tax=Micromonospora phaseoli TaxID=1144548 RepID=A0A1H7DD60_9ACTN|nr:type VII secretion protein EccCa [Micromonospora phaseoli]PZV90559.1 S-DNA-T family DNA segregation ATPase FtsK/SpoIIIE [Micromonospora phaseoli]GIJ78050.1 type VII secretion protein EccC [Micromonospora phaseoli]SEJ99618.1 DNA segregation ATPase FtsK/SpoIIIE, S-DNA-T family [Micromonospora phaseoli]